MQEIPNSNIIIAGLTFGAWNYILGIIGLLVGVIIIVFGKEKSH
jgi:hypothetical protein